MGRGHHYDHVTFPYKFPQIISRKTYIHLPSLVAVSPGSASPQYLSLASDPHLIVTIMILNTSTRYCRACRGRSCSGRRRKVRRRTPGNAKNPKSLIFNLSHRRGIENI